MAGTEFAKRRGAPNPRLLAVRLGRGRSRRPGRLTVPSREDRTPRARFVCAFARLYATPPDVV